MDTFYLGSPQTNWLKEVAVPLFVSRRRLVQRKRLPRALGPWALDSGGFSELSLHGKWTITPGDYIAEVRRYRDEVGRLDWAAPQDWMCEPWMVKKTGLTLRAHQQRTLDNYLELRDLAPDLPFIPVLQGWDRGDYLVHVEDYARAGIDLAAQPLVGLGSVCRRQHLGTAREIVSALRPLRLHGFGFKLTGLEEFGDQLASADSMAWSYGGRRERRFPECRHQRCANCLRWALHWLGRVERAINAPKQGDLFA